MTRLYRGSCPSKSETTGKKYWWKVTNVESNYNEELKIKWDVKKRTKIIFSIWSPFFSWKKKNEVYFIQNDAFLRIIWKIWKYYISITEKFVASSRAVEVLIRRASSFEVKNLLYRMTQPQINSTLFNEDYHWEK